MILHTLNRWNRSCPTVIVSTHTHKHTTLSCQTQLKINFVDRKCNYRKKKATRHRKKTTKKKKTKKPFAEKFIDEIDVAFAWLKMTVLLRLICELAKLYIHRCGLSSGSNVEKKTEGNTILSF